MSLKILGGRLRGLSLVSPPENITRPTSTMLRRRIFDSHQDMQGITFLDLCAGSGSVGFEAYSRGAQKIFFIENHFHALTALKKNVASAQKLAGDERAFIVQKSDSLKWLKSFLGEKRETQNIVIFFDPPYEEKTLYEDIIKAIKNSSFAGELWIESCRQKGLAPETITEWWGEDFSKLYWQGTSYLGICSLSLGR